MSVDLYDRAIVKLGTESDSTLMRASPEENSNHSDAKHTSVDLASHFLKDERCTGVEAAVGRGERCELIDLTTTSRPGAEQPSVVPTSHFKRPKTDLGRYSDYALRVIRYVDKDGADTGVGKSLEISSAILQKSLRPLLSKHAFLNFSAEPIVIDRPFAPIFHLRADIEGLANTTSNDLERQHLTLLLEKFCKPYLSETVRNFQEEVPQGLVRYELLWTLFKAEDDIIVEHNHYREVHRVMHCEYGEDMFLIYTWRWGYNAGKFGPCSETVTIPRYSSIRQITQLSCYPVEFVGGKAEQDKVYAQMIERGRRWRGMIRPSYCEYTGPMWRTTIQMDTMDKTQLGYTKGRVMLDHVLHSESCPRLSDQLIGVHGYRLNARDAQSEVERSSFTGIRLGTGGAERYVSRAGTDRKIIFNQAVCHEDNEQYSITDEEALLSPARTRGLSLTDKSWAFFLVDSISSVQCTPNPFNLLALDPNIKDLIRGLVEEHDSDSPGFDDIVEGKGKGVIISLEGPPGAGKTLTAESVAALTHRPLYNVSTSELGTVARDAERGLLSIFSRAERWKAIVLLDEADLFLTKRTEIDLERNALVTVFLRTLEYFKGFMFLTSNRVDFFDPAFESRIHLRVRFDSPDSKVRAHIWRALLPKSCTDEMAERLGKEYHINGRQIKNLIRISLLLARHKKEAISEEIIQKLYYVTIEARDGDTKSLDSK